MTLVQGDVSRVRGFQVGGDMIVIAPLERIGHQRIAVTLALMRRIHPDQREIPVRRTRMVGSHLFEHAKRVSAKGGRDCALDNLRQRLFVRLHSWRESERDPNIVVCAIRAVVRKRVSAECPDETRHARQVLM